ncbi:cardiolipin synthase [Tritonibacter mobilis]|uniref:cardiolipin synthase n=1 Tax=Tritonibacter mobilis TaxID=379347 RepID=UPI0013B40B3A|nr:cardiolipin synthase [Tritonibacter mobilis]
MLVIAGALTARAALNTARTPQGASAWVVFLISFPLLALPAFALFGGFARLSGNRKEISATIPREPAKGRLDQLAGVVGRSPSDNNTTSLLIDGEATFEAIFNAIDEAEHEILVQFYIMRADDLGLKLQQRLIAAARRGVEVRVLCDLLGSLFLGVRYVRALEAENIQIRGIPGPHRALGRISVNFRNHRKAVVIDGKIGFTGGLNVGQEYIDGGKNFESWRDTHVRLTGPMAVQLREAFCADWFAVTGQKLGARTVEAAKGDVRGLIVSSGPTDMLERGSMLLCGLVNLAQKRLWIATPYLVPHTDLTTALQLAALRGVDVRILIPEPSDNFLAWYASRGTAATLTKAGIEVLEYAPGFMHSKVILIDDDLASVGTMNFDIRSALLNFEQTALIEDRTFATRVEEMLCADFDRSTPLADPARWHVRILAPVARLFGPLL